MKKCILALAITIAVGLAGCLEKTGIDYSSTVPAAEAELKTSQDNNGNTVVDLKVKHLAPPQNLQPPMSMYVAWVETPDGKVFNAGRLKLNDNLEGMVRVTTPYPQFRVIISAENDPLAAAPGSHRILETKQIEIQ
jgi:hypothetical protein